MFFYMEIKLLGSKILKIHGEKNSKFSGKLKIDSNIKIISMEKFKPEKSEMNSLKIESSFIVDYGELGKIEIIGEIFLEGDEKDIEEIIKDFNDKKFDSKEHISIINVILQKFSIKAFEIEEELNLPIHIKLPSFEFKKE